MRSVHRLQRPVVSGAAASSCAAARAARARFARTGQLRTATITILVVAAALVSLGSVAAARRAEPSKMADAQLLFYNAHYQETAALALALRRSGTDTPELSELRSSALLFQLKELLEDGPTRAKASACPTCPALIADFLAEFRHGQDLARSALALDARDETALFLLGKIDLNYVWLQLGPLHKKTGWDEYWEARTSLDEVLRRNPAHVRAKIARAWIAYIVDTRMPWGTRWVLGGGDRRQALIDMRAAVQMDADLFTHAEAEFALWDIEVREGDMPRATEAARRLSRAFPENRKVAAFLDARDARLQRQE